MAPPAMNSFSTSELSPDVRLRQLSGAVLLVAPIFHSWDGRYSLGDGGDDVSVMLGDEDVTAAVTASQARLFTPKFPLDPAGAPWHKRFSAIRAAYGKTLTMYSVPFPIRAVRVVLMEAAAAFMDELESLNQKLRQTAEEFSEHWADARNQIRNEVGEKVWSAVHRRVPETGAQMAKKFWVDATPIQLAGGELTSPGAASLHNNSALLRDSLRRHVDDAIDRLMLEPRQAVLDAMKNLTDLVSSDGNVTAKTFGPIQAAIQKLRNFASLAGPDLLQRVTTLSEQLDATRPSSLTSSNFGGTLLAAAIADTAKAARDEVAMARISAEKFGRASRRISLAQN